VIEAESGVVAQGLDVRPGSEKRGPLRPFALQGILIWVSSPALWPVAGLTRASYIRARRERRIGVARKAVLHEEDYAVGDGRLRLSVIVGEKQFGSSMVFLNDELIANGIVDELPIGNGKKLDGCTLAIYTLVTDIRDNTDEMSVTWILNGGAHRLNATETGSASKKFGSQMFKAVFHLTGD
jgi:hypothetical protein